MEGTRGSQEGATGSGSNMGGTSGSSTRGSGSSGSSGSDTGAGGSTSGMGTSGSSDAGSPSDVVLTASYGQSQQGRPSSSSQRGLGSSDMPSSQMQSDTTRGAAGEQQHGDVVSWAIRTPRLRPSSACCARPT
jgi:hypothetical protein